MFDFITDMWREGWLERMLLVLMLILAALVLAAVGWLFYWAADSWFREQQQEPGVIIGKSFSPAHTTTTFIMSGKVMVPIIISVPDTWTVFVRGAGGKEASASVSQDFYSTADDGKKVGITYHSGRISGGMYIDQLSSE